MSCVQINVFKGTLKLLQSIISPINEDDSLLGYCIKQDDHPDDGVSKHL